jgi:tetratricopeptide (TPR) repeat protein
MSPEVYARVSEQAYLRERATKSKEAARTRAKVFVDAARAAQELGDIVAAAQHYRLALQLCEDAEVRRALTSIDKQAQTITFESALKQAVEAERAERWATAAARYTTAYAASPEPRIAERIAHALLRQGTDLRRAVSLAEEAVVKEPKSVEFRMTLAEACLAAGLQARAAGEISRALVLAPDHPKAMEIQARVQDASRKRPNKK